ncbi:GGDEF domain-containing protein [Psychrobium sp. 1_MG-2023]|uniref:GGDEF domain-containing protein n=1 Tax=Psychrobium sp. 1_MG-2023 TaxID=3062624 RepID=UPI000C32656E|nr:GGDEF domain-containing protein [Psychrobium sp. 1_MG-2023]MDP2559664.1 GGDEF domain-containing protein [Psychrobium sp. 1_MG-2023]PKF59495.1 hypothetical protein CW748_01615 [Alteromonadales bacterium alter-6D02]
MIVRSLKYLNRSISLLVLLTLTVIYLQQNHLNHIYLVDHSSGLFIEGVSDGTVNTGTSTNQLLIEDEKIILECEIKKSSYNWPFCEISIFLHDPDIASRRYGVDLSSYDYVKIFANQEGMDDYGIRFHIRNYNEAYSKVDDQFTWKYNAVTYKTQEQGYPAIIPLNSLQVTTWWLAEQDIPLTHAGPEFSNAMQLEIVTGHYVPAGKYKIILDKIEFHGKRFKSESVYQAIIAVWVVAAIILIMLQLLQSRYRLQRSEQKAQELKQLNKLLNLETQELKDRADRDPLTGALNRKGVEAVFAADLPVLSIIFLDIDFFKSINDNHGHNVGDDVLKIFSRLVSQSSRDTDFLVRWGGEEFLLVCPNTHLKQAKLLAESLRVMLEKYQWPNDIPLTSSFGVAEKESNEDITSFIHRADKALYDAKAQGRNRVIASHSEG